MDIPSDVWYYSMSFTICVTDGGGMPKLIFFVVCLVVFAVFSAMNAGNKCDISFIFKKFEDVNIVIALVLSFTLGVLFTLPIALTRRAKPVKNAEEKTDKKMTGAEKKAAKQRDGAENSGSPEISDSGAAK